MNLEPLARWLSSESQQYFVVRGGIARKLNAVPYDAHQPIDDDQLLGAINCRCAELDLHVWLYDWKDFDGKRVYSYVIEENAMDDDQEAGRGPTPLSAALAAVEELTKETT